MQKSEVEKVKDDLEATIEISEERGEDESDLRLCEGFMIGGGDGLHCLEIYKF